MSAGRLGMTTVCKFHCNSLQPLRVRDSFVRIPAINVRIFSSGLKTFCVKNPGPRNPGLPEAKSVDDWQIEPGCARPGLSRPSSLGPEVAKKPHFPQLRLGNRRYSRTVYDESNLGNLRRNWFEHPRN